MKNIFKIFFFSLFISTNFSYADCWQNPVRERICQESRVPANYFNVLFHKPNYVLPYYYNGSPYYAVYRNHTPSNQTINHAELKYQLSLKVPLWYHIFCYPSSIYFAYTQQSYLQMYNRDPFFRETDYEPEVFFSQ